MRTNSIKCISSVAKSSENSIEFFSNPEEYLGLNSKLRSICQSLTYNYILEVFISDL